MRTLFVIVALALLASATHAQQAQPAYPVPRQCVDWRPEAAKRNPRSFNPCMTRPAPEPAPAQDATSCPPGTFLDPSTGLCAGLRLIPLPGRFGTLGRPMQ